MLFSKNPYANPIPEIFLNNCHLMKNENNILGNLKQNGYAVGAIKNDLSKNSISEITNYINLSETFRELRNSGELCPSNYLSKVLYGLKEYDKKIHPHFDISVYNGYLTRALRAYASFIREMVLEEEIAEALKEISSTTKKEYRVIPTTLEDDIKNKTDIMFEYDNKLYRVWSYQITKSGQRKTGGRLMRNCAAGINVLFPFDIKDAENYHGWYLYKQSDVTKTLVELLNKKPTSYKQLKKEIVDTEFEVITVPQIFEV